ncbi:hypothetical protein JDV02_002949 [Purpureocillium takamizusanense]|uniref:CENP-V/GFA domain-containing protein n=1 Tax=Purpureocillium takamizusanense TaxID=2060973 RepID=A0A9Q8V9B9_9HYPO|nr:uncharacterized protein JDV02_002949 [Purpureocillium takamizusanense]UNI16521.1 hypothetical protein JDV02_002949 [Purpureocillium takamizusanense]
MKSTEDVRLPLSTVCHCNSCRETTGQLAAFGVAFEKAHLELSFVTKTEAKSDAPPLEKDRQWVAAATLLQDEKLLEERCVSFYDSSVRRRKIFCPRCGVSIGHTTDTRSIPAEWGWPEAMAVMTPTIDREFLASDWWVPERATWTACGIPWVRNQARSGLGGLIEHPLAFRDKVMGDDIGADLELLKILGESIDISIFR